MEEGQNTNNLWVKEIGLEAPKGFKVSNSPITYKGNLQLEFSKGYSLPTIHKQSLWDNAYYTSHVHPNREVIDNITSEDIQKWNASLTRTAKNSYDIGALNQRVDTIERGGSMNMMQNWTPTTATKKYYLPAKLAVPFYNDTRSRLSTLEAGEGGQVIVDWEAITGKPDTFNPSAHIHAIRDVAGLQDALNSQQLWKVDEDGNIYTEYNAYSLKELSAFGLGEEEGGGGGGSMDRLDKWVDYDASKSEWVLSAFLGDDLNTRVTAIDGRVTDLENSSGSGSVTSVGISVPTGLSVSNSPITSSGVIAIGLQTGYSIPTTDKQGQWDTALTNNHTHDNKGVIDKLTQANIDVLEKLSIVDGNLKIDANTYSTGNLSAFGLGEEGGGSEGGSISMMQGWTFTTATENYYLPAKLAVPFYIDTRSRLSTLEAGTAPASHTHTISDVTGLQTALNNKLETSIFNTHNTDNVRHITGAERTKWDGVVTDFAGLEIGGRNLLTSVNLVAPHSGSTELGNGTYRIGLNSGVLNVNLIDPTTIETNTSYTLSYKVEQPNETNIRFVIRYSDNSSTTVYESQIPFTTDPEKTVSSVSYMYSSSGYAVLINPKLEKGTKATDWTTAPEDQVSDWNTTDVNSFSFIKNKPTTLSGYGITDAYTKTNVNDLLSNKADKATKITAGKGLTGGGTLAADRTITLGKPSTLTASTTNEVTDTSHTHSIDPSDFNVRSLRSTIPNITTPATANSINYGRISAENAGNLPLYYNANAILTMSKHPGNYDSQLAFSSNDSIYYRSFAGEALNTTKAWYKLAFTTDNVASATKLQTPRTLWGQSFNGEANVSGAISGITTLAMTGALTGATILNASQNVNTPKVSFGNGWTAEGVGAELQFKLNGVIQAKIVNGALVSMGEVTAFY